MIDPAMIDVVNQCHFVSRANLCRHRRPQKIEMNKKTKRKKNGTQKMKRKKNDMKKIVNATNVIVVVASKPNGIYRIGSDQIESNRIQRSTENWSSTSEARRTSQRKQQLLSLGRGPCFALC